MTSTLVVWKVVNVFPRVQCHDIQVPCQPHPQPKHTTLRTQTDSMTTTSHPSQSVTLRTVLLNALHSESDDFDKQHRKEYGLTQLARVYKATEGQKHVPKMTTRKKITLT